MSKDKNLLDTVGITLSTNPVVVERLERLVLTGAYGKNAAEAAERLLALTLHDLDKQQQIPERPAGGPDGRRAKQAAG